MRKTMICVYAPSNKGKTRTIKKVHELLGGKKEVRSNSNDFVDNIMFGEVKIGFESAGDPDSEQEEAIEYLMKKKCDIVIGAARTRGKTVKAVEKLEYNCKYQVIWLTPAYVYMPLNEDAYDVLVKKNAEIIIEFINRLIQGRI